MFPLFDASCFTMTFPPRSVLLRISNSGAPLNKEAVSNGVLILPSMPLPPKFERGRTALFHLCFQLNSSTPLTRDATLYTNLPAGAADKFDRYKFQLLPIESHFDQDIIITVPVYQPGSFCYYIAHQGSQTDKFYINVPPNLELDGEYLPFNAINVQLVVSKWIGKGQWDHIFRSVAAKGYNMIHFTPLQERGSSNLPYSIYDQLRFDPHIFDSNEQAQAKIASTLRANLLLAITDVVWNHTADNSEWLRLHPDAGYNAETAPHLQAAIELDAKLLDFLRQLAALELPTEISSAADIAALVEAANEHVFAPLNLWQFYVFDRVLTLQQLEEKFKQQDELPDLQLPGDVNPSDIKQLAQYAAKVCRVAPHNVLEARFSNKLDAAKLLSLLQSLAQSANLDELKQKAGAIIDEINADLYREYDDDLKTIKKQISDRIRFLRLDDNGPKLGPITEQAPLTEPYFTRFESNGKKYALANNGWIWGGNPLVDFASLQLKAYLRREVIVWGDCVKLRYGAKYEDSPYLWDRMIEYTKLCAATFSGFRIDNCHLTPLHVGERLLDEARKVNPNLYVVAELFSGSEEMDKIFVERLGINTLIREAMQAWSVGELLRLVHKHGGRPIGSMSWMPLDDFTYPATKEPPSNQLDHTHETGDIATNSEVAIPKNLASQLPHALFMDCTHDNETPNQKRTVEDTLSTAALVAFCSAAIGSTLGFDECYPALLDVVGETREYTTDGSDSTHGGIGQVKRKLHAIRRELAQESVDAVEDNEMYIHHEDQYITVQRHNLRTGKGWFLIARTKFSNNVGRQELTPPVLGGTNVRGEFAYRLDKTGEYQRDDQKLTGVPTELVEIELPSVEGGAELESKIHVNADTFVPGSIAVFSTSIPHVDLSLDQSVKIGAIEASLDMDLYDLNAVLFKCEAEERDASGGAEGVYVIPGVGSLVYAGLEGWILVLKSVIWQNNLGSAVCDHLRGGEWAFDYVVNRLDKFSQTLKGVRRFQAWLRERIDQIRRVPFFLRPHYFCLVVGTAYEAARFRCLRLMNSRIQTSNNFIQRLALTSVQMCGRMNNTSLKATEQVPCIAAGLPHFANDYMRCWGRDVFISFRGLFLVCGRDEDAKQHILGFAQTLKHGLIPNLLDAGRNPRYNARDAAWFFCQAVQEYVINVKDGIKILDEKVKRRFPLDDEYVTVDDPKAFSYETSIRDIIYEILARHARGIKYREANAGPNLDLQMKDNGFNVEVNVDWSTGLIHGGSQDNCGTWMDKMGESEKAHSKGVPGTPRDGAAVELQGLLKSTLRWVNALNKQGNFDYTEVTRGDGSTVLLQDWEELVQTNFERCFYVPRLADDDAQYDIDLTLVNRRGIYKDLYKTGKPYEDYQLRPNFAIAMTVAPELFDLDHALGAIDVADKVIRGPLGMRTLDPLDYNYRPYYNNGADTDDFATSKGRNYHQGPEWVWCIGYFFRAFLHFRHLASTKGKGGSNVSDDILCALTDRLAFHVQWIRELPWSGLTELTNKDGEICHDLSPTQAWSLSCLLDMYYDLWNDGVYQ